MFMNVSLQGVHQKKALATIATYVHESTEQT